MSVVGVLNAGGWGTALAAALGRQGHQVRLWARRAEQARALGESRQNSTYLPGVLLPETVVTTADLECAVAGCDVALLVPISAGARALARRLAPILPPAALVVHGTKGLEVDTLLRMSEVIEQELGAGYRGRVAALSGPTHAEEVGRGIPTAAVVSCADESVAAMLQERLNSPALRVYTNRDIVGVELCASLKNVVALAAGMSDGLGGGDNAKAALMTRSLAEIGRLARAAGGQAGTVAGLAGVGDLIVTCTSQYSRNRRAGEQLGRGRTLNEVVGQSRQVIEGIPATRAGVALAARLGVEMPIAEQVHAILFESRSPLQALAELMAREPTAEESGRGFRAQD
ncbi:MAG TPA: NAD(P)H-dependent glycerol-3-phosphate dehydrogenase [Chloroflexota bacterium]|nr:NAD(P)H-dependent glycerol-3-phosphate dehydrogenase [Chloroflexota bacterium]